MRMPVATFDGQNASAVLDFQFIFIPEEQLKVAKCHGEDVHQHLQNSFTGLFTGIVSSPLPTTSHLRSRFHR